jgi:hypothetical protein
LVLKTFFQQVNVSRFIFHERDMHPALALKVYAIHLVEIALVAAGEAKPDEGLTRNVGTTTILPGRRVLVVRLTRLPPGTNHPVQIHPAATRQVNLVSSAANLLIRINFASGRSGTVQLWKMPSY